MKKINCKHGLHPREEIAARRMRRAIEGSVLDSEEIVKPKIKEIYNLFLMDNPKNSKNIVRLYKYIQINHKFVYSAFERLNGYKTFTDYVIKNKIM